MKQIILSEYRKEENNSIIGKTVKDISYINGNYNQLIKKYGSTSKEAFLNLTQKMRGM